MFASLRIGDGRFFFFEGWKVDDVEFEVLRDDDERVARAFG